VSNGGEFGGWFLKVVCKDYPRPDIDMTANFLEAAALSAFFRSAPRPTKPLNVVIAGAGDDTECVFCPLKTPYPHVSMKKMINFFLLLWKTSETKCAEMLEDKINWT